MLIPVSTFTSTQVIKLCNFLGPNEDFSRFGTDEETLSGVVEEEIYRNSTQLPGSQVMTLNISSINDNIEEEFNFDNLAPLRTFEETLITDAVNTVINDRDIPRMNSVETTNYDGEDMNFEPS